MRFKELLTTFALMALMAARAEAEPTKAAFFGLLFINTSLSEATAEEAARVAKVEAALVDGLVASGRYTMVDIAPVADKTKLYANMADCNGCDTDLAVELGADVAITAEVQKTSDLILGMTIYIREAGTGALVAGGSADMRGNSDDTWLRTLRYLLKNRLLN